MGKKRGGIELVAEAAAELARGRVLAEYENGYDCESPIECILYAAMKYVFDEKHWFIHLGDFIQGEEESIFNNHPEFFSSGWISKQHIIGEYRVDFVIRIYKFEKEWKDLIVECDGHDFHERTKEQAKKDRSRDRALQAAGYKVYRFTGSEIWNDPLGCALQVWQWAREADTWR